MPLENWIFAHRKNHHRKYSILKKRIVMFLDCLSTQETPHFAVVFSVCPGLVMEMLPP